MTSTNLRTKIMIYPIIPLCLSMLVQCKPPENDLKRIETFWCLNGLHVYVSILTLVLLLVLSIKMVLHHFLQALQCFPDNCLHDSKPYSSLNL